MWRFLYRLLAWMSGGPTYGMKDALRCLRDQHVVALDAWAGSVCREGDLSRQLGEAHAKINDLESECNAFCEVIDGLLQKEGHINTVVAEAHEAVAHARQSVVDGIRREARLNDTVARWKTAHDTMKQQRDEALEQLAAIQDQTAKYVRT